MSAYSDRVIADGATHYWRLGEPSGTTAVATVGGANGTISGGVTLAQPGAVSGDTAMVFDGSTGTIALPSLTTPLAVTVEGWGRTAGNGLLLSLSGPELSVGVSTRKAFASGGVAVTGTRTLTTTWHHLVFVFDGAQVTFYVDGVLDATVAFGHGASTGVARIGAVYTAGHSFWPGDLDEIAIYPTALSPATIAAHYTIGSSAGGGVRTLSFGWWKQGCAA